MSLEMVRRLYEYHRWANRRLFGVASALGEEATGREMGPQFSFPTVRAMFGHLYGADSLWLARWRGTSPTRLPGAEFATLAALRLAWDTLEQTQRDFLDSLQERDLERVVRYRSTEGKAYAVPLEPLLQHVVNHATHHRSEIATMLTMISGGPPDTGLLTQVLTATGQLR
jgi:uncharacterized damage-inducible protein DinB